MSKIGEKPVVFSKEEVSVDMKDREVIVIGKEGEVHLQLPISLKAELENSQVQLKLLRKDKKSKSLFGLYRSLIANAVSGVQTPWTKRLELVGTGYLAKLQGEDLELKVGYSHPVIFQKVPGIKFQVEENNKIIISGVDKQLVGQVADRIKAIRRPDVYKGKGIKYEGERLRIKPGKKAKTEAE